MGSASASRGASCDGDGLPVPTRWSRSGRQTPGPLRHPPMALGHWTTSLASAAAAPTRGSVLVRDDQARPGAVRRDAAACRRRISASYPGPRPAQPPRDAAVFRGRAGQRRRSNPAAGAARAAGHPARQSGAVDRKGDAIASTSSCRVRARPRSSTCERRYSCADHLPHPLRGDRPARSRRRYRGARRIYPPDSVRRRPRDHSPGQARPDPGADDAGPDLRPAHRYGLRAAADLLMGRQPRRRARCTVYATQSSMAGRAPWKSRSTATRPWPARTPLERPACHARFSGATWAPTWWASIRISRFIECPFTGEQLAAVPAIRPDVGIIHAQRADRAGNVLIEGIVGVQKEVVLACGQGSRDRGGDRR